jgi:hypothetical protein
VTARQFVPDISPKPDWSGDIRERCSPWFLLGILNFSPGPSTINKALRVLTASFFTLRELSFRGLDFGFEP